MPRRKNTEQIDESIVELNDDAIDSSEPVIAAIGTELIEKQSVEPLPTRNEKAVRFFELAKIPYCQLCGKQYENTSTGEPICRLKRSDCPRINNDV